MIDIQNYLFDSTAYRLWLESTNHSIFPETDGNSFQFTNLRQAAVSIILVEKEPGNYSIVFGQRSNDVPQHKGQIAFPGGGRHKDESALDTAIRETLEETGLKIDPASDPHWIYLGEYPKRFITVSDFLITPFIFIYKPNGNRDSLQIHEDVFYKPDGSEIIEVFDVPLSHLLNDNNVRIERREWQGHIFNIHYYTFQNRTIWGVTGMLLFDFLTTLKPYLNVNN